MLRSSLVSWYVKVLVAVLLIVVAAAGLDQVSAGTVSGTVKGVPCSRLPSDQCQKPMPNVEIQFVPEVAGHGSSTTTKANGTFEIDLRPGRYQVRVHSFIPGPVLEGPDQIMVLPFASSHADFLVPSGLQ